MLDPGLSRADLPLPPATLSVIEWRVSDAPVPYETAVPFMERRAAMITSGEARELIWLLEHPPLYTVGTSGRMEDVLDPGEFPVHRVNRGGQVTYHGPGQRVCYVLLDLTRRGRDVRRFVAALEEWLIATLAEFNVRGERRESRVGIWVRRPEEGIGREDKIAAIGVRVRRWVSFHGISLNVDPDLGHYAGIVPCGVMDHGVTSLAALGLTVSMPEVDIALRKSFQALFGPVVDARSV